MDYPDTPVDKSLYRFFPHRSFRFHQKDGLECIRKSSLKGTPLLFNSPTGTGKTAMVLGGILESRASGEKLVVITRTHSQYRIFVEEFHRVKKRNPNLSFGMLIGRANLCPIGIGHMACGTLKKASNAEIKNGSNARFTASGIQAYERALSRTKNPVCPYYENCFQTGVERPLFNREAMELVTGQMNSPVTPEAFTKKCLTERFPKCPYELMKATLSKADVMILHYQYLLDPDVREAVVSSNWLGCGTEEIHLVVDEAHNLAPYIQDICSTECTKQDVEESLKLLRDERIGDVKYPLKELGADKTKIESLLAGLNLFLDQYFSNKGRDELLGDGTEDVITGKELGKADPSELKLLEQARQLVEKQFEARKRSGDIPDDAPAPGIVRVEKTLKQATNAGLDRYITTVEVKPRNKSMGLRLDGSLSIDEYDISLKVADIDPRDSVKYLRENFRSLTLISGTLTPTTLYRRLLFPDDTEVLEMSVPFPFPEDNRLVLGCRDTSSQKRLREDPRNIESVKECIKALFEVKGNIAIFFTGYDMKRRSMPYCLEMCAASGKKPMDESREINRSEFIDEYKKHGNAALFAVCKGSFSEGVDYIGEAMNAVAVIGLPLAPWTDKQQLVNRYYERVHGPGIGKTIAYDLPAVTAAVQAAGRCIRSPVDTGVILLADARYTNDSSMGVKRILPEWIQKEMQIAEAKGLTDIIKKKQDEWTKRPKAVKEETKEAEEKEPDEANAPSVDDLPDEDKDLYIRLKSWRMAKARESRMIPYRIFSDNTLKMLARCKPKNIREFGEIKGVGPEKSQDYGQEIVSLIKMLLPIGEDKTRDDYIVKAILETVRDTDESFGAGKIAEILSGSRASHIKEMRLDELKHYAGLSSMNQDSATERINSLVREGFLYRTLGLYPVLKLKEKGRKELRRLSA